VSSGCIFPVFDFFFPRVCVICGRQLSENTHKPLCIVCKAELESGRISGRRCPRCGISLTSEQGLCLSCREQETPGPDGRGLFYYRGAARVLLQRYKFGGVASLSPLIAEEIFSELRAEEKESVIVPIPSSRKSRRRNGWGHMERVASHLKGMGLTVCPDLLVRSAGKEQKKLDRRAREENSRAVFRCTGKRTCKSIVLLDDVRTTGASLRAASAAIEAKGSQVKAWIVFAID